MKNCITLLTLLLTFTTASFANLSLVGHLPYPGDRLTDIWGYTHTDGHEFAIFGLAEGVAIVDITTDPTNPTEVYQIPHVNSGWRDIKVWDTYAYVTNEDADGVMIIDLTYIHDSIDHKFYGGVTTAHNIFIDEQGYAYVVGSNLGVGGAFIIDVATDPWNPTQVGLYNTRYIHDLYVRNDTMWSAEINDGILSIVDVSDKWNPTVLTTFSTPSNFTHNCWISDDGKHVFTTDEVSSAFIGAYDISDYSNVEEVDRYQSSPGSGVIPHNTFFLNDFLITSYYRDGVVINDVTHPDNIVEIGSYDTSPLSGNGFNGCWGVYPYFASGLIIASDMEEGLFVLQPTYTQAAYLNGTITDSVTSTVLQGVEVEILGTTNQTSSDLVGIYKTGTPNAGTYTVRYSKPGYWPKEISGVTLTNGSITIQDVELVEKESFSLVVLVLEEGTNDPIEDAEVRLIDPDFDITLTTNATGAATMSGFYNGTYDVFAGKWGWKTKNVPAYDASNATNNMVIHLPEGYYDDFVVEQGWSTAGGTFLGGEWVREEPLGTGFPGIPFNPEEDIPMDFGRECFVTGNTGLNDFPAGGEVELESPEMDLTTYMDPYIYFHYYFANYNGDTAQNITGDVGNDSMIIVLSNGTDEVVLDRIYGDPDTLEWGKWVPASYRVKDALPLSDEMTIEFTCYTDFDFVNFIVDLTEAGVDGFEVRDSIPSSVPSIVENYRNVSVYPNPATDRVQLSGSVITDDVTLALYDPSGRSIAVDVEVLQDEHMIISLPEHLASGLYSIELRSIDKIEKAPLMVIKE